MKHRSKVVWSLCATLFAASFVAGPSPAIAENSSESKSKEQGQTATAPAAVELVSSTVPQQLAALEQSTCAVPAEGETVICITPTKKSPDPKKEKSGTLTPMTVQPIPLWCAEAGVLDQGQYRASRYQACGSWGYRMNVVKVVNGTQTITGVMDFTVTGFHYGAQDIPTVAHQITVIPSSMTGDAVGTTATATAGCWTNCIDGSADFGTQVLTTGNGSSGEFFYSTTATSQGAVGPTGSNWNLTFKAPSATNTIQLGSYSLNVRCDTAVPGVSTTGCVIPALTPFIQYQGFSEFGAHVTFAQQSGLPGALFDAPLHRLTDDVLRTKNRTTACPGSYFRPPGKSCDEYPFASTHEGAFTGGGQARTWPWCLVVLTNVPSTGATGYSVCMIDEAENSYAGSLLNSVLYVPMRVIEADAFYVDIQ